MSADIHITSLLLGILFAIAGGIVYSGRAVRWISAWNAMAEEEKKKIRIRPLCRNIGGMIGASGLLFLLNGLWPSFREHGFIWCILAWLVLSGADVYWIGTSGRYQS